MLLCCGEALIDMIPEETTDGTTAFAPRSGGAIFNTAIALGRLGVPASFLSGISTDLFGQQLLSDLYASNVDTAHVMRSDRPTTLAFVQLTKGHAKYDFYDENTAGRMLHAHDFPNLTDDISALYCGGISLACEPCGEAYSRFISWEGRNRVVMLDPNIRPSFIKDQNSYRERLSELLEVTDILKVSDEDLIWITGAGTSIDGAARSLLDQGPSVVIVTKGKNGAIAFTKSGHSVHAAAQEVNVVDTVGAGDAFNAGVLAHLYECSQLTANDVAGLDSSTLKSALEFGASVAARTVSRAGANPPWQDEIRLK